MEEGLEFTKAQIYLPFSFHLSVTYFIGHCLGFSELLLQEEMTIDSIVVSPFHFLTAY